MRKFIPLLLSCSAYAAQTCDPASPAACNRDNCEPCYCLGPAKTQGNAPVRPYTCNGDFVLSASALYWKAQIDGLEYGYRNNEIVILFKPIVTIPTDPLIDAQYLAPKPQWRGGFKIGIAYHSPCDGWDLDLTWTHFKGRAKDEIQGDGFANPGVTTFWTFWAADQLSPPGSLALDNAIATWSIDLNDLPLELGREFWVSKYLSLRPYLGVRYISLYQTYNLSYLGGAWGGALSFNESNYSVEIHNNFRGIGPFAGINTNWHFGCGWSVYGDLSGGIIYGRFTLAQDESSRLALSPFSKRKVLDTEESFRVSRALLNMGLGIEYSALVCDCKYGITAQLGWEQHLYFHQNQMWRVVRNRGDQVTIPNNTGENVFEQTQGTLNTSGLTLRFAFAF